MENYNVTKFEPFIRNDQYNFIKYELKNIISAYSSIKDKETLNALKLNSLDKILKLVS